MTARRRGRLQNDTVHEAAPRALLRSAVVCVDVVEKKNLRGTAGIRARIERELAAAQPRWRVSGLTRGSVPYVLARILDAVDRPVLVVCAHGRETEELVRGLQTMVGERAAAGFLQRRIHPFPAREAPPLEMVSVPVEVEAGRIAALYQLAQLRAPIVVASVEALALRTLPPTALAEAASYLVTGDDIELEALTTSLLAAGYRRSGLVEEPGDVAVRGGIVDFWPPGSEWPCRVELLGDTIESIRTFDPSDQRSVDEIDEAAVLPAMPFSESKLADPALRRAVHERCNDLMLAAGERRQIDAQLAEGLAFPGYELLLPYVYEQPGWLGDYLSEKAMVVVVDPDAVAAAVDETFELLGEARAAADEAGTLYPDIDRTYVAPETLRALLARTPLLELEVVGAPEMDALAPADVTLPVRRLAVDADDRRSSDAAEMAAIVRGASPARDEPEDTRSSESRGDYAASASVVDTAAESQSRQARDIPVAHVTELEVRGNQAITAARARVRATRGDGRFRPMVEELERARAGAKLVVLAADPTQLERLAHLLALTEVGGVARAADVPEALAGEADRLWLVQGRLEEGFRLPADGLVVVTDEEIFGERRRPSRRRAVSRARMLSALTELVPGDYMVHVDHGIGVYRGLKHIQTGTTEGDFIHLEYAGGDRLYLPVDRINLVEKYTGSGATPVLARLGSQAWSRTKKKAKESILRLAHELLELEAFRAVHTRDPFAHAGAEYEEFEAHFPFEETEDQKRAIRDVVGDLARTKPMDRVVCGDVGYGKTEVALRATYLAAMGGKQVAVLVPTTVLARQHYDTFRARFADHPLSVEMLSRFHSAADNKRIVTGLRDGSIDVVIGTHRLLQRDVSFKRLGLLVVDEEHRFGVKAKERLKQLRREVDVLTLTATPIPRTLQLALTGVRDLSVIETPPVDRLAIRTFVARTDDGLIKQAIEREIARGGQVFFVHNRVASIGEVADKLAKLVPKARIAVAHGQMEESVLERIMLGFLGHESDVLLCTSIIESGLDIPNANTVLIDRADTFGLAQLYQIRGRVGRSHRRAFAYLLVPAERAITEEARQRLAVLQQLDDLGAGFRLAAHDMEIRGAGNLLGKQQSGHVAAIGFELFMQMMEEAAAELRGSTLGPRIEPEIELGAGAFIPEGYIDDIGERLLLYKRMANAPDRASLAGIADEMMDRFGPLPRPVADFVRIMGLRPSLKALGIESLKASEDTVAIRFHEDSSVDRELLVEMATRRAQLFRLRPGGVFTMRIEAASWDAMVDAIEGTLDELLGQSDVRTTNTSQERLHARFR